MQWTCANGQNDGSRLFRELVSSAEDAATLSIFENIAGPYAFAFWQVSAQFRLALIDWFFVFISYGKYCTSSPYTEL